MAVRAGRRRRPAAFLRELDPAWVPVMALGPRLEHDRPRRRRAGRRRAARQGVREDRAASRPGRSNLRCGGGASGILVSSTARDAGIAGLEFLRGIPGTVGGFVRMNGGAYGREVRTSSSRRPRAALDGEVEEWPPSARLHLSPQRSARRRGGGRGVFQGVPGDPAAIGAEMDRSPPRARNRSRCAAAPAARPSRIRRATRRGR
jgi:UDP-N-acetylmuramate dehydrogenase